MSDSFDDDIRISGWFCKKHSCNLYEKDCPNCEDGFSHHDCGEDCCPCADPENNVSCDWCDGKGFSRWCPKGTKENPCSEKDWEEEPDYFEMMEDKPC